MNDTRKVEGIQALRGIAILLVLLCHLSSSSDLMNAINKAIGYQLNNSLYWGVELFFVISGYVVTRSIISRAYDFWHFAIRRIFRLYPAILFALAVAVFLNHFVYVSDLPPAGKAVLATSPTSMWVQALGILGGFFINLAETPFWPPSYQFGAMWSLTVEFQFYFFTGMAMFVFWILKIEEKSKYFIAIAFLFVGSLFLYRLTINFSFYRQPLLSYLAQNKFDYMASGVLLAYAPRHLLQYHATRLSRCVGPLALVLLVSLALSFLPSPLEAVVKNPAYDTLNGIGSLVLMACCVYIVACCATEGLMFANERNPVYRTLVFLGNLSFILYLVHFSVFVIAWLIINHFFPSAFHVPFQYGLFQLVLSIAICLPVCWLGHYVVERRGIAIGERILNSQN